MLFSLILLFFNLAFIVGCSWKEEEERLRGLIKANLILNEKHKAYNKTARVYVIPPYVYWVSI